MCLKIHILIKNSFCIYDCLFFCCVIIVDIIFAYVILACIVVTCRPNMEVIMLMIVYDFSIKNEGLCGK